MKYRPLGRCGLSVSEIGFGAWGIGGQTPGATSYGPADDRQSRRALEAALDAGITFFDTAPAYGDGHSESLIGEVLGGLGNRVVIATKGGCEHFATGLDFSTAALTYSLDASLRRLRRDAADLYQLHNPPAEVLARPDAIRGLIDGWKRAGRIKAFGISVDRPENGLLALDNLAIDAIQVNFNLVDQRALDCGLFAAAAERDVSIIARTPLCFGFLSGTIGGEQRFSAADHRSRWSAEQIRTWTDAVDLFGRESAAKRTPAQLALAFCLSFDAVATTIPGMMAEAEVAENVAASALGRLSTDELERFRRVYQSTDFFVAAAKPQSVMK